jgi:type VI secretion system ImpM family protein
MPEIQRTPRAFCLGKLPQYSDFVCRGIDAAEADLWFEILAQGLALAREQSGGEFEAAHDGAPPWRFVSGPCEPGDEWRAGAMAPSVDRAGRRFFFLAGLAGLDRQHATAHGASLTRNLEDVVYRAVGENLTVEAALAIAEEALCGIDAAEDPALQQLVNPSADGVWWTLGGEQYPPRVVPGGSLTAEFVAGFIIPPVLAAAQ